MINTTDPIEQTVAALKMERGNRPFCAYIYDLRALRSHVRRLVDSLPPQCRLFYAVKANSDPAILKTLAPIVHGFEVASAGEIGKVRQADPDIPVIFGGPGKTDGELKAAIRSGVSLIHVESVHELRRLEHIAAGQEVRVPILLRVNLLHSVPEAKLKMAGVPTQFGIDETQIPAAIALAQSCGHVELQGFHFHAMSNNLDFLAHAGFVESCIRKSRLWGEEFGLRISYVNVGGGVGVNYQELEQQFDWTAFAERIHTMAGGQARPEETVLFECGRYLTASCGYYAAEVLDIKRNHGGHYLVLRGGTHHFRLPAAWKYSHPFRVVPIEKWDYPFPRPELRDCAATVAGELCTPNDILARDVVIPRVRIGDIVVFPYTGAYGFAISHHDFLSHSHPEHLFLE